MSAKEIRAYIKGGPSLRLARLLGVADRRAKKWREDCYVYLRDNVAVLSQGPDLDHPKREPDYVARYVTPARRTAA